jgi:hypothetical protein
MKYRSPAYFHEFFINYFHCHSRFSLFLLLQVTAISTVVKCSRSSPGKREGMGSTPVEASNVLVGAVPENWPGVNQAKKGINCLNLILQKGLPLSQTISCRW